MAKVTRLQLAQAAKVMPQPQGLGMFDMLSSYDEILEETRARLQRVQSELIELPPAAPVFLAALREIMNTGDYATQKAIKPLYDAYTTGSAGVGQGGDEDLENQPG